MDHLPRPTTSGARRARPAVRLAALAAAGALTATLAACGSDDEPADDPTDAASSEPSPSPPSDEPSSAEPTPDEEPTGDQPLIYFANEVSTGVRLVAEPVQLDGDSGSDLSVMANLAAVGTPIDPDYRNLLSRFAKGLTFATVEVDNQIGSIRAELLGPGVPERPAGVSRQAAELAVQSLVYTVQAAADSDLPVQVVDPEGNPTTLLGVDTASGLSAARPLSVLSLVNVLSPFEQSVVDDEVEVSGRASSFEGTVVLKVLDEAGKAVFEGSAQGTMGLRNLTPWSTTLDLSDLEAGTYLLVAQTDDPTGGTEGPGPNEDTKTIVVE